MDGIIRLTIPAELKKQFQQDKYLLEKNKNQGIFKTKKIEEYLNDNNIIAILNEISSITSISYSNQIKKENFFQKYLEWLTFALEQILSTKNIQISNSQKKQDMYLALKCSQEELDYVASGQEFNRNYLIKQAEYFTFYQKKEKNYTPEIKEMCSTFIDIALNYIQPETLVDISYEAFLQSKQPTNILIRKKINSKF